MVEALEEVVVHDLDGTLVLPTFSIDGTMHATLKSGRVFDVRSTPSNLGAIPEVLRGRPAAQRSIHPTHSFGAIGEKADWIVRDHHRAETSFGRDTPMVRAMEAGGWIAGLGTELGTVTFYHSLEDLEPSFPIPVYSPDSPFSVECIDWDGKSHKLSVSAHNPALGKTRIDHPANTTLRNFFTSRFESEAGMKRFSIGEGRGWTLPLGRMYEECKRLAQAEITVYTTPEDLVSRQSHSGIA